MRIVIGLSVLMFAVLATTAQAGDAKEKKISVSDCPKAVQATLKREVGKGKIVDVDVRKVAGKAIYESEVWYGDLEYDIVIRGDGTLLSKVLESEKGEAKDDEGDDDDEGDGEAKQAKHKGKGDIKDDDDDDDDEGDDDDEDDGEAKQAKHKGKGDIKGDDDDEGDEGDDDDEEEEEDDD